MTDRGIPLIAAARQIFRRGLVHGSTGNLSVRTANDFLISPSGSSFEDVTAADLSTVTLEDQHISGPKPSKESFLHAAILTARPQDNVVIHTHSLHSTALSCLDDLDPNDAIPALTPYFAMRVDRVLALPYHAPGDTSLASAVSLAAQQTNVLLLRRHGPVISAPDFDGAIDILEELEQTCALFFLLCSHPVSPLNAQERADLRRRFQ